MILVKLPAKFEAKGFTLIEVLIGLTLLSIMVVLLFTSLKICADSWERGEKKISSVNEMAVVYHFFQKHLSVTKPILNQSIGNDKAIFFQGDTNSLQFASRFPESVNKQGLQIFKVALVEDDNGSYINVSVTPYNSDAEDESSSVEEVSLIKHVREFKLSYFGSSDGVSDGVWAEDWHNEISQPRLVRINIVLENGNYWPEMIIPLRITKTKDNSSSSSGVIR